MSYRAHLIGFTLVSGSSCCDVLWGVAVAAAGCDNNCYCCGGGGSCGWVLWWQLLWSVVVAAVVECCVVMDADDRLFNNVKVCSSLAD